MRILICGGAGYIGSHMVKLALGQGHDVIVVDNLSTGHEAAVRTVPLLEGDIGDKVFMTKVLTELQFDLVMHFCAFSLVGESVEDPQKYYRNNVAGTLNLLEAMLDTGHRQLVFSSTAAVYGNPTDDTIAEDHPKAPINPYGKSKWMVEQILQDYALSHGLNSVSLRYFNAAGAAPDGSIGEKHDPETHLIPNILKSIASGGELSLKVFGTDYPTGDGSCVRDYVHVNDLASAHLLAGEYLAEQSGAHAFNLGNGTGFSVLEVINAAGKITGQDIDYEVCERRPGDPATLVADSQAARKQLQWTPEFTEIDDILASAWPWHRDKENFLPD